VADAYINAVAEKKRNLGSRNRPSSCRQHMPEANRITHAIRTSLKAEDKLSKERVVKAWIPAQLTDAQKADADQYDRVI